MSRTSASTASQPLTRNSGRVRKPTRPHDALTSDEEVRKLHAQIEQTRGRYEHRRATLSDEQRAREKERVDNYNEALRNETAAKKLKVLLHILPFPDEITVSRVLEGRNHRRP